MMILTFNHRRNCIFIMSPLT